MDYFFSDIVESSKNRTFLQKIKSFSEQAQQQVYVLKGPLTDAKYTYDIDDVCIILTRGLLLFQILTMINLWHTGKMLWKI